MSVLKLKNKRKQKLSVKKMEKIDEWFIKSKKDEGGQSYIYNVSKKNDPKIYILKEYKKINKKSKKRFKNEINALIKLQHSSRVIHLYDYNPKIETIRKSKHYCILELADESLDDYLKKIVHSPGIFNEKPCSISINSILEINKNEIGHKKLYNK